MIKLVIMDVDGVLTDGRIILDDNGVEYKFFDVKDGHIFHIIHGFGIKTALVSGRHSRVTKVRAEQLGVEDVYQGIHNKLVAFEQLKKKYSLSNEEIAYIGDDVIDIPPMILSGFSACPSDAHDEVKKVSDYISSFKGGRGAVRDIIEYIMKQEDLWGKMMEKYLLLDKHDIF
ncbi:KdsC family phosphatase [Hippea maritima]|uniref:3-deoxy-D-manno-octulosonate 8-phosphate phosphatase, YrbI family n=1 Tax=Hippea maritima (strain ATCC 700847 / DSM 10411 / MH2) TaxID=760142 RepID=F2LUG8_HIPMA|nr:HAD hydrolase family protein [Hippea maritima]AEA33494.1 3-deoxy-D-manno-octulosonate 8-phosphate phosphatase, YrbI family [Hippea maritima DSM 10411]